MNRNLLRFVVASWFCTTLLFGQATQGQGPGHFASAGSQEELKLLGLAMRAGVSRELQVALQEGIRSWSSGKPQPLRKIVDLLEAEEGRMRATESPRRQADRVGLLQEALLQLTGQGNALEIRQATKGLTGSIQGRVTDASSGLPLDFEFVEVYNALGEYVDQDLTDEGDYTVDGLSPGMYFVLTDTDDHLDELYDNIPCPKGACSITSGTPVQVTEDASTTVDFELTNGGRVLGIVTDAGSGLPLRSEFVRVFDALGDSVGLDLTDSAGHYLVGGLPTGTYYALVDADDHLDELYDNVPCPLEVCGVTSGTPIAVTLGSDTSGINFVLDTGGRIVGHVSEQLTGLPLDFAFVDLYNALGERVGLDLTDSSGAYLVGGLPSGTYFAATDTLGDYFDELYDDIPCPDQSCDPTSGTPIPVDQTADTTGIDFVLSSSGPSEAPRLTEHSGLIVPILVDLTDPVGRTTFFAVHNTTDATLIVDFRYYTATVGDEPVRTDQVALDPASTTTLDVRSHLTGYDTSGLDQLTGIVLVAEQGSTTAPNLVGDAFSLDSSNDFASGDKLIRASDLCNRQKIRFVDFGSGTEFKVLLNEPRGVGTPSFSYNAYNQSGALVGSGNFFAEEHFILVDRSVFASQSFGVLDVDFGNAVGGHISATFSAFGRFSVDLGGECVK